jgi:UDP-N-acetylmuramoyl-L-alanyl-D-glutamate--2,6-diaminopimelate ligase
VAVFTNLTLDHLDYHKTMEAYREAKLLLFKMAPKGVINIDDEAGLYMIEKAGQEKVLAYSTKNSNADLFADQIKIDIKGTYFKLTYQGNGYDFRIQTPGLFSVYNALAAIGATLLLGVPMEVISAALSENSIIEGRFEVIESPTGFHAIVDYAHAPDGLENVLKTISEFAEGRIITVFGCGGDRDRTKRPIMGGIAARYSDHTIMTSDNPRTEDPEFILDEIEEGLKNLDKSYERITNRIEAIYKALKIAEPKDVILVAGKGHENYQIIGKTKHHMDDKETIKAYLQEV